MQVSKGFVAEEAAVGRVAPHHQRHPADARGVRGSLGHAAVVGSGPRLMGTTRRSAVTRKRRVGRTGAGAEHMDRTAERGDIRRSLGEPAERRCALRAVPDPRTRDAAGRGMEPPAVGAA